jgi:hypothetical protein
MNGDVLECDCRHGNALLSLIELRQMLVPSRAGA